MAGLAEGVLAVAIPGESATLPASATAQAARDAGLNAEIAESPAAAVATITARTPGARILICGSLYLAGQVLRENG
jgi:dihydrofolate synthase/folylpolyglutamate synthase